MKGKEGHVCHVKLYSFKITDSVDIFRQLIRDILFLLYYRAAEQQKKTCRKNWTMLEIS